MESGTSVGLSRLRRRAGLCKQQMNDMDRPTNWDEGHVSKMNVYTYGTDCFILTSETKCLLEMLKGPVSKIQYLKVQLSRDYAPSVNLHTGKQLLWDMRHVNANVIPMLLKRIKTAMEAEQND